jgi:hypothetical protein
MLFLLKAHLEKPAGTRTRFWRKESGRPRAHRAGAIKAIWKAAGRRMSTRAGVRRRLGQAILNLPLWARRVSLRHESRDPPFVRTRTGPRT